MQLHRKPIITSITLQVCSHLKVMNLLFIKQAKACPILCLILSNNDLIMLEQEQSLFPKFP